MSCSDPPGRWREAGAEKGAWVSGRGSHPVGMVPFTGRDCKSRALWAGSVMKSVLDMLILLFFFLFCLFFFLFLVCIFWTC